MLVGSRVLEHGHRDPERPALHDGSATLTYGDVVERAEDVGARSAAWWPAQAGPAFAALHGDADADRVATLVALMMAGWAVGVLDPAWTVAERDGALRQLAPHVCVDLDIAGWKPCGQIAGSVVSRPGPGRDGGGVPSSSPTGESLFYVGFTSGSSGVPKAFARNHRSWWASFVGLDAIAPLSAGAVIIPGPLSSSHFLFGALHGLHAGARVELLTSAGGSASRIAERLHDGDPVAALYVVPSMLQQLVDLLDRTPAAAPATIFCAGARLDQHVRDDVGRVLPDSTIVEYYGASELSFVAIRADGDGTPPGSVGRAFPEVQIAVRDANGGPCAPGAAGRIFVRSPLVFSGYRGAAPTTGAERIDGDWWTVGDVGHLDDGGNLFVVGRGSSLIITGGANVQPEEVEQLIAAVPGIAACVVVGVDDPRWGQVPVAVLTCVAGATPTRSDLRRAVARHLARHKRPRRYVVMDALPRGRTGKLDRDGAREALLRGEGVELR